MTPLMIVGLALAGGPLLIFVLALIYNLLNSIWPELNWGATALYACMGIGAILFVLGLLLK